LVGRNAAVKTAVASLVQLSKRDLSQARLQLVTALFRAADATRTLSLEDIENTDRGQLVKEITTFTQSVRNFWSLFFSLPS
jgi:hypothetical protein